MDPIDWTQVARDWADAERKNAKERKEWEPCLKPLSKADAADASKARLHAYKCGLALHAISGAKPNTPSTFYVHYGDSTYNIPATHVVSSMTSVPLEDCWGRVRKDATNKTAFRVPSEQTIRYHDQARDPKGQRRVCWLKVDALAWPKDSASPGEKLELLAEERDNPDWLQPRLRSGKTTYTRPGLGLPVEPDDVYLRKSNFTGRWFPEGVHPLNVLARYIGREALMGGAEGARLLLRYFLGVPYCAAGQPRFIPPKDAPEYRAARARLLKHLQRVYWVVPDPVEPLVGPNAELYSLGEFDTARARGAGIPRPHAVSHKAVVEDEQGLKRNVVIDDVRDTPIEHLFAPQPFILAGLSITKDAYYRIKDPPSPPRYTPDEEDRNASGYLFAERGYLLCPEAVDTLVECVRHYDLANELPMFANLHDVRRREQLNLAALRARARAGLGPAPLLGATFGDAAGAPDGNDKANSETCWISSRWSELRSKLPFEPPYVKRCCHTYSEGVPDTTGGACRFVLDVCQKNSVPDRGGSHWLDLDAFAAPVVCQVSASMAVPPPENPSRGRPVHPPGFDRQRELVQRRLAIAACVPPPLLPDKLLPLPLRKKPSADAGGRSKKRSAGESTEVEQLHAEIKRLREETEQLRARARGEREETAITSPAQRHIGIA